MFARGTAAAFNILKIIERKKFRDRNHCVDGNILNSVKGHIELRNISFSYPSRPNLAIFEKFCLSIPAGKTVAIVGASGSGYSHYKSLSSY